MMRAETFLLWSKVESSGLFVHYGRGFYEFFINVTYPTLLTAEGFMLIFLSNDYKW